jgi:Mitochondrial carrier protein
MFDLKRDYCILALGLFLLWDYFDFSFFRFRDAFLMSDESKKDIKCEKENGQKLTGDKEKSGRGALGLGLLVNMVASATSTGLAELLTLPLCTIKTNYQNTDSRSIISTTKALYSDGGICRFYSASVPAITSQILSTSTKYVGYEYFKAQAEKKQNSFGFRIPNFMCGIASGILSSLFTHPVDAIKISLQMSKGSLMVFKQDPRALYRGYSKTLGKVVVGSSLFLPLHDAILPLVGNSALPASFFSALISTSIVHPLDYLKTRHIYGLPFWQGWNPRTYYKGFCVNVLRIVPHFVITMSLIPPFTRAIRNLDR